jgi:hypothetical protein
MCFVKPPLVAAISLYTLSEPFPAKGSGTQTALPAAGVAASFAAVKTGPLLAAALWAMMKNMANARAEQVHVKWLCSSSGKSCTS